MFTGPIGLNFLEKQVYPYIPCGVGELWQGIPFGFFVHEYPDLLPVRLSKTVLSRLNLVQGSCACAV